MAYTTGEIIATPEEYFAFKVIFRNAGRTISEHGVSSRGAGDKLVALTLPTLHGFETG